MAVITPSLLILSFHKNLKTGVQLNYCFREKACALGTAWNAVVYVFPFPFLSPHTICETPGEDETQHHTASNTSLNSSHFSPSCSALDPPILRGGLPNTWSQLLLATEKTVGNSLWFKGCQSTPLDAFSSGPDSMVMQSTPVSVFIMARDPFIKRCRGIEMI